jgi:prepilin-type N-terminal cleavage/methylation domain-containing protein
MDCTLRKKKKSREYCGLKGFTLIELLVTIVIIGILVTIVMASIQGARGKAQKANFRSEVREGQSALVSACDGSDAPVFPLADTDFTDWGEPDWINCGVSGEGIFLLDATFRVDNDCVATIDEDGVIFVNCD